MSIDRSYVGRVTGFVVSIALGGALMAQSGGQTTQQPPTQPTAGGIAQTGEGARVDHVTGEPLGPNAASVRPREGSQLDPSGVALKPDAMGLAAGKSGAMRSSGKIGPAGKVVGQGASSSPDGPAKEKDPAIERLGPGATVGQAQTSQPAGPGAARLSEHAKPEKQLAAQEPVVTTASDQAVTEPGPKGGLQVFVDPATGQIAEPTDAQLQELDQQNQAANVSLGQSELVERPALVGDGMILDIPTSLFPMVTATIAADGKVTLGERQAEAGEVATDRRRSKVEQSAQSGVAQRIGPAGELEQSLRSENSQRLGPAGDAYAELPPPAEVIVTIQNGDGAGEGFNDPTAAAPVFGNPGTTRGAQRLNVFRAAGEYWGAILKSPVPILVDAKMDPQSCTATSAVLGSAGPSWFHRDFPGAPAASTWYPQATANSRAGVHLNPGTSDIGATFNSDIDNPTCLGATSWWYGIGAPAPAGTIDFFTVVLHEIGHGIGVLSLINLTTGAKAAGFDDAYERWLWDANLGAWSGLTNAQRVASAVSGQVTFRGPRATAAARGFLGAGLNGGWAGVFAPNPVQGGSSISHFDTILTPNELMEPAITAPPGPYAYLTSGLLEDVGWQLLSNGVFDFAGLGTWVWSPTNGWLQTTPLDPSDLEPWNGNFVGTYAGIGTWLWNGTNESWSQLTPHNANHLKACGNNLLWASAALGTWRWNSSTGWAQLSPNNPESLDCIGGDAVWEGAIGTWIYNFSTGAWSQITANNPTGVLSCGSRLVWWRGGAGGDTWYWEAASGWHYLTVNPEATACYRGQLAWEGAAGPGTWLFNFSTSSWAQITNNNPEQMLAWGPNLAWESAALGTWIWDGAGWTQITPANPARIEALGADLLWSSPADGTWVWSGAGGGAGWTNITSAAATEIVSTGAVK